MYVHNKLSSVVCRSDYIFFQALNSIDSWILNKCNMVIWDKSEVLLGTFWGKTWELGESFGTSWEHIREHDENKERKYKNKKILAPLLPEKGKFWTPHGSMLSLSLVTFIYMGLISSFDFSSHAHAHSPNYDYQWYNFVTTCQNVRCFLNYSSNGS